MNFLEAEVKFPIRCVKILEARLSWLCVKDLRCNKHRSQGSGPHL
jgi:hypothetical protein